MPRIDLECQYCNHCFSEYLYDGSNVDYIKCPICKDSNLKVMQDEERDAFGYENKPKEDAYIKRRKS